ncbi:MAG TPA: WD40 repeat domain-containing protein, partial [Gemmataceae bacterium]|nr:WD40 repeat domain-containing protein [Gemmataceae bacterium]
VYSPDGKLLATAGKDGTICLWDPATGKKRRRIEGQKAIENLVFSPDGKCLASWCEDESIRLWDPLTGKPIRVFDAKQAGSRLAMAFSPDSALLALGGKDGSICLWDMASGEEKRRWQAGAMVVRAIAFSPDGKTLASGAVWDCIRLWDVATGQERHPSPEHRGFVDFVRYSPDGASLISIGRDRRMLRWDLAMQTSRPQFTWPANSFSRVALSPDGLKLAVGTWADWKANLWEVRLWDVGADKPGRLLGKLLGKQKGWYCPIAFSPDGRRIASGGKDDHVICIWDASNGKEVRQITDVKDEMESLCFSPDSTALACSTARRGNVSSEPGLYLWNVASGKERTHFDTRISDSPNGTPLAFSPDGRVLAAGAGYRETSMVRLWDTATGKELCRHTGHGETVGAIAFSPDGKLVASGAGFIGQRDNSVHVWETATGRLIRCFEGHHSCVATLAFSPDGLTVASGAGDSTILLWDITSRRTDGRWHAKPLTLRQLEACWTALANEDAAKAYDAGWALVAAPEQAVPFLQKHLPPLPRPDAKTVARLLADLDSDHFMTRQKATEELSKLGDAITPALRRTLENKPSLEVRRRIQQLLDQSRDWTAERLRDHRAIQVLEHIGTLSARERLQALAEGAPEAYRTEEAKTALRRLSR